MKIDGPLVETRRAVEQLKVHDPVAKARRYLEMANMVDPTAEAQRAFAQQRAYEQFYASYASTVHSGLEPVFDEKESTKRTPDETDESRAVGPSLELRQDIQASRSSPVVHAPPERAEKFLHFILPCDRAEDRIGDLEEKFHKVMLTKYGYRSAVRYYWLQTAFLAVERIPAWIWISIVAAVGWLISKMGS